MRRQRRRTNTTNQLFCRTNGCPSIMTLDPATGLAAWHICGFELRLS